MGNKKLKNETVVGNRSQAEQITCDLLRFYFKKLEILTNDKTAIGKELDIYLPKFKVAIELDGIFHYKNIHGDETLARIQANDLKKSLKCEEAGIKLFRITLPEDSRKYFTLIKEEVSTRLVENIKKHVAATSS